MLVVSSGKIGDDSAVPTHRPDSRAPPPPAPRLVRHVPERFVAWLVTGPLGHLYGALADLAAALAPRWYRKR